MKRVSILNHVIGPIMRGPSSSHTAGPWRIGRTARDLLGSKPKEAVFTFDPKSSLAVCFHDQGSDAAFVAGLLGHALTDDEEPRVLELAPGEGLEAIFKLGPFPEADHPNSTLLHLRGEDGGELILHARSVGGGSMQIASINGFPVMIKGDRYELAVECEASSINEILAILKAWDPDAAAQTDEGNGFANASSFLKPEETLLSAIKELPGVNRIYKADPVMHPLRGKELFAGTGELLALAAEKGWSLGETALEYESALLELPREQLMKEMGERLDVMLRAVELGLSGKHQEMKLLRPFAGSVMKAEQTGKMFLGGPHARAATRAMAAMHVNGAGGVVCAAPTGGSAGVMPGVVSTLLEDMQVPREKVVMAMWAAGAIGLALDRRSTFAAEVAGCQVEIGAAGAMSAAAVVEAGGGSAGQGCAAGATVFQNMMGSVCDLIQGIVEIPCHSRNAALASQAFLCADLVLGGYENPVPLDETVDAVDSVGRMLPEELRCTSRGGLAVCPSSLGLPRLDLCGKKQ